MSIFNDKLHVSKSTPHILYSTGQNNIFYKPHKSIYRKQKTTIHFQRNLWVNFEKHFLSPGWHTGQQIKTDNLPHYFPHKFFKTNCLETTLSVQYEISKNRKSLWANFENHLTATGQCTLQHHVKHSCYKTIVKDLFLPKIKQFKKHFVFSIYNLSKLHLYNFRHLLCWKNSQ